MNHPLPAYFIPNNFRLMVGLNITGEGGSRAEEKGLETQWWGGESVSSACWRQLQRRHRRDGETDGRTIRETGGGRGAQQARRSQVCVNGPPSAVHSFSSRTQTSVRWISVNWEDVLLNNEGRVWPHERRLLTLTLFRFSVIKKCNM